MSFGESLRKAMDSETIEPPPGPYKVRLDEASAFEAKDGREFAKVILEITDGKLTGSRFQHFMGFQNEIARSINGEALAAYGVDMTSVETVWDLDDQLTALVKAGTTADVSVSYRDGYIQVKVHGSRTQGVSDIPTDEPQPPAASFASAAGQNHQSDDESLPF